MCLVLYGLYSVLFAMVINTFASIHTQKDTNRRPLTLLRAFVRHIQAVSVYTHCMLHTMYIVDGSAMSTRSHKSITHTTQTHTQSRGQMLHDAAQFSTRPAGKYVIAFVQTTHSHSVLIVVRLCVQGRKPHKTSCIYIYMRISLIFVFRNVCLCDPNTRMR